MLQFLDEKTEQSINLTQSKMIDAKFNENENGTDVNIKFSNLEKIGDLVLQFLFSTKSVGYYSLKKIMYKMKGDTYGDFLWVKRDIYFPYNFSYHCSPRTTFINNTVSLHITDMQFEIDPKNGTFSDAYDCVGFTSIPIWTGIFVTTILALIMIWALTMIMDIRTMDRFDDPKGKTITISAAE